MDDINMKQIFLKQEIIDKFYNPDDFKDFILLKKENGTDLDNWNLEELKLIVKEFQEKLKSKSNSNSNSINLSKEENNSKLVKSEVIKKEVTIENKKKIEKINDIELDIDKYLKYNINLFDDIIFNEKIECKKSKENDFNKNKIIDITIRDYLLINNSYITYYIETVPNNYAVSRRFKEFEILDTVLRKYYPSIYISPLPPKKLGLNKKQDLVKIRMNLLELYLKSLFNKKEIRHSLVFEAFLNHKKFEDFVKLLDSNKLKPDNYFNLYNDFYTESFKDSLKNFNMENLSTLNGENYLLKTPNWYFYEKQFKNKYINLNDSTSKINKNLNELLKSLNVTMVCFQNFSNSFNQFQKSYNMKNSNLFTGKEDTLNNLINKIKNISSKFSTFINDTSSNFEKIISPFFQNYHLKYDAFSSLFEKRKFYCKKIMEFESEIENLKIKNINKSNIGNLAISMEVKEKYSIMNLINNKELLYKYSFPVKTKKLANMKVLYLLFNNNLFNEYFYFLDLENQDLNMIIEKFKLNQGYIIDKLIDPLNN